MAMERLKGKTALVIGAGTVGGGWGNGKACAVQYAREGARVVCFDLDAALAEETAAIVRGEGGEALAFAGNAARAKDVKAAVELAVREFGGLNLLLNNVGIVIGGGVVELSEENWDKMFAVNLKSAYLSMKYSIPIMVAAGGGSIVNISSISGIRYLGKNYVAYYTTKAALNHMTRVTAAEYAGRQVRVNALLPGLMDTPMAKISAQKNFGATPEKMDELWKQRAARIPMGWMGDAFDVARAAAFFASDESRFITGQTLVIDGGMTLAS